MQVAYLKMHGTGNRILVVDQRITNGEPPDAGKLRELGNEETGPGFDQLMWITDAIDRHNVASYRVFNADGSEVQQCGNGVRCVALVVAGDETQLAEFTLESPAGPVNARLLGNGMVSVSMGCPEFEPANIPFLAAERAPSYEIDINGHSREVLAVSMGNPHCVLQVDDVDNAPVADLGPLIEHHARYPERANAGFMRIVDRQNIQLRVHERGVGETLACGTGACAAVVCGQQLGLLDEQVNVQLPGGQVVVSWRGGTEPVWLTGNVELISEGTMDL